MQKKYLIFRILGNDLPGLHGNNQTLQNLEFTLLNEANFPDTEKIYLLNRIFDTNKKTKIKQLLDKYKFKFIDIPFNIDEFNKIKYNRNLQQQIDRKLNSTKKKNIIVSYLEYLMNSEFKNRQSLIKKLYNYNLYLINNNGSRNFCLEYGKEHGYEWTFVLDSNSYFTNKLFENIVNHIEETTEYISIPQIRLSDNNIKNDELLDDSLDFDSFPIREPQIAFKNTSKIKFNKKIPYGTAPKAELLRVLNIPGPWDKWKDNELFLNIKDRQIEHVKFQILSKIIRLNAYNSTNTISNNFNQRIIGLNNLVNLIRNTNN
ncbi:hypothetical protein FPF71_06710 [Algibacter amylolyticus]|uniref:Uncharacterized protein n=1 Tax=Algibacter amylolyticus TaxID=1608400 RepID=A0A5M7B7P3_9FLAO|nr:hypothetical protein [Algibacter amylolyticus]KAA5825593.1 hypothetical protein F2B50_06710 [Algibacter amylolyticus]MBB5268181.1 hypothetical protein [Algibacter amylolyticus]TSJ79891.1 hypothetical protein FPF71_06710 [Algibacter amylolyticus]